MNNKIDGLNANMIIFDEFKKLNNKQGENKMKQNKNILSGTINAKSMNYNGLWISAYAQFGIKQVIFNPPYTIVLWEDKSKTIVKQSDGDDYDEEKAFCWAVAKRALDSNSKIDKLIENANRPQEKILKKNKSLKIIDSNPDNDILF